jgi:acetylornithine deacetylase
MDVYQLTRALVDIESITGNEAPVARFLEQILQDLARDHDGRVERMEVEPERFNLLATFGDPVVTLSTHLDTVPPFFASREDDEFIWGRGACDVKGIIAAMIHAARQVLQAGHRGVALLFVVGEERNSAGAYHAGRHGRGSRYLINGEPTSNRLALGSKGALRFELTAHGRMAHSAYPELGDSAILKLIDALNRLRALPLPVDDVLGPCTMNIGVMSGGRAPNVIPDRAQAEIMFRLVGDPEPLRALVRDACAGLCDATEVLCIPAVHLGHAPGFETTVVAYTTDIPAFQGAWGRPFLLGPGTIHVAHTSEERVPKRELAQAVDLYRDLVVALLRESA